MTASGSKPACQSLAVFESKECKAMYPDSNTFDRNDTYNYTTKKHEYHFNTPNSTDKLTKEIVDILVSSILSTHDNKLT